MILALDSDLLESAPGHVRYGREFAQRRNPVRAAMNRVYAVEATPTLIGAAADHRHAAGPEAMHAVVAGLAGGVLGGGEPANAPAWLHAIVSDLKAAKGRGFVHRRPRPVAGGARHGPRRQRGAGRARADRTTCSSRRCSRRASLAALRADMEAGRVEQLLILDCNPVFTAPGFLEAMGRVPFALSAATALDETGLAANWFVPLAHPFEAWGDARGA